jgi:hypothetical protein
MNNYSFEKWVSLKEMEVGQQGNAEKDAENSQLSQQIKADTTKTIKSGGDSKAVKDAVKNNVIKAIDSGQLKPADAAKFLPDNNAKK